MGQLCCPYHFRPTEQRKPGGFTTGVNLEAMVRKHGVLNRTLENNRERDTSEDGGLLPVEQHLRTAR
jgi:hypothetical protein